MSMSAYFFLIPLLIFTSCKKNPVDRLTNPLPDGDVAQSSGIFIVYDDDLKTGGGLGLIPSGGNQTIDLTAVGTPARTLRHIQYSWSGADVGGQHLFAGFQLLITPDSSTLSAETAKNLSAAGYTRMTLYVRGQLSDGNSLRIEGPSNGDSAFVPARTTLASTELTNDWQSVTLTIPPGDFSSVKIFATFSFQYTQPPRTTNAGGGGSIFVDEIRYER